MTDSAWVELLPPDVNRVTESLRNRKTTYGDATECVVFLKRQDTNPGAAVAAATGYPLEPGEVSAASPACTSGAWARAITGGTGYVSVVAW